MVSLSMCVLWIRYPLHGELLQEKIFVGEAIEEGGTKKKLFSKDGG